MPATFAGMARSYLIKPMRNWLSRAKARFTPVFDAPHQQILGNCRRSANPPTADGDRQGTLSPPFWRKAPGFAAAAPGGSDSSPVFHRTDGSA